jgi:pimeloyl-ACP methyl ester carboxylesterase
MMPAMPTPAAFPPELSSAAAAAWAARGQRLAIGPDLAEIFVIDVPAADGGAAGLDPVLVLHGFPSSSFDWRHVLGALSARRRVVLFDHLGFGFSDKPDRRYSIELYADVAEAVVLACGLHRFALLTHDLGDSVGGELLARQLDGTFDAEVSARVLSNGSIYIDMAQLTPGQQLLLGLDDERFDVSSVGLDPAEGIKRGLAGTFAPDLQPDPEELEGQWAVTSYQDGHQLLARTIRYIEDRREREDRYTGAIEAHPSPLFVLWGDLDPVAVHAMTDRLLERRPGTPRHTLEGVGHYPMVEAPERFASAAVAFLDGLDGAR